MKRNVLYKIVLIASMGAIIWLGWNMAHYRINDVQSGVNMCLFKRITGIPCPSCGTTRSVLYLARLDIKDAVYANPFGFIIAFCLLVFPVWVGYDLVMKKSSFFDFYRNTELFIGRRWVALSLILLVIANWSWNIYKFRA